MSSVGGGAVAVLRRAGVAPGDLLALSLVPGVGLGLAAPGGEALGWDVDDPVPVVAEVEEVLRPRWVLWSRETAVLLVRGGVRVATCWDVAAVHRILCGGWRADPGRAWASLHDLPVDGIPTDGPLDLFSADDGEDDDEPVRRDGHLSPTWVAGGWARDPGTLARWAMLAADVAVLQQARVAQLGGRAPVTAHAESTTELLCAELSVDGLPLDRATAEAILADAVGPRPRDPADEARQRAARDARVLRHAPAGAVFDLRSPGQVRSLLRTTGIEVPDTRAWRLESLRGSHAVVEDLLAWRKAERVATTYGYAWLDEHLQPDGRLRGGWSGADGAAGRMTASAGLHNMPADVRPAVLAEAGHVFVRADLGQIEPRVLAAISGDPALAAATAEDDLYAPVAEQLGVERAVAKVAVLGALYGQTTGRGAEALQGLRSAYPVAMAFLDGADRAARGGEDLRTTGGRLIRMDPSGDAELDDRARRARAGARGRYGRNAVVQGAAAELFKVWAVTVRARVAASGAKIVLCLHDELLVHAPDAEGEVVRALLERSLVEAAHRWAPGGAVRFVAETSVVRRWSDAKG